MMISVILADDHPVVRDGLCFLLNAQPDIKVVGTADNGHEAVQLAAKLTPDIAVMDIAMPLLNGIDATQQITSTVPHTRVMILSIHFTSVHIQRALQAGAMGYLLKESAGEEVVEAIRTVYEGRRYLSRKIAETVVEDYVRQGGSDGGRPDPFPLGQDCGDLPQPLHAKAWTEGYDGACEVRHPARHHFPGAIKDPDGVEGFHR
jgi:DNA-binding NarL/FixJ family response regulator